MAKVTSTQQLLQDYDPKLTVYVEGSDDVLILGDRWFTSMKNRTPRIEFVEPPNGGGCQNVIDVVQALRCATKDRVYGLLDRDALTKAAKWDLFKEPDDDAFVRTQPFGAYIRVLKRWEIENYLVLDLHVLAEELKHYTSASVADAVGVGNKLLQIAELLKPITTAILWSRQQNPAPGDPPDRFGQAVKDRAQMEAELFTWQPALQAEYATLSPAVDAFDSSESDVQVRWLLVNRILDGKRLVRAILHLQGCASEKEFDRFRSRIAERLAAENKIDAEIMTAILHFEQLP